MTYHGLHRIRRDGRRVGVETVPVECRGGGHSENFLTVGGGFVGGGARGGVVVGERICGLRGSE